MFNEDSIISKWVADMYDQKVTETNDVDFLLSVIGQTGKRILEVCCGSGRILVPLAKAGHNVSGFDADEFMLAKIPLKAGDLGNIEWRAADAVYDEWGKGFDVVVLGANILYNIVSDMDYAKSQELFIQKAASALVPGGYVYIDYHPGNGVTQSPPSYNNVDSKAVIWEGIDSEGNFGRMVLVGDCYDAETHLDSFLRRFELTLKSGETMTQEFPCHKHSASLSQLHEWLKKAGFVVEQEYGDDYKKNPVTSESGRVIIYARKAEEIIYVPIDEIIERKIIACFGDAIMKYDMLPKRDGCYRVAAMYNGQVVGFAAVSPSQWTPPLAQYGDVFIHSIEVDESFRRRGIGRKLITMLEDWARDIGYRQIRAWSSCESPEALHMWYAMGYAMCPAFEPFYENGRIAYEDGKVKGLNPGYYYAKILSLTPTKMAGHKKEENIIGGKE